MKKVILMSIDGMRPDGFLQCGHPFADELMRRSSFTLEGRTVYPSVTLPCHTSLFHSIPPERHGTLTNTYMPPVRPVNGLFEQIHAAGGKSAMFYGWEPLRNVSRPSSLAYATYIHSYAEESSDTVLTNCAMDCIERYAPDFVFLYQVETDEKGGHDNGWMTDAYLQRIYTALDNAKRVIDTYGDTYDIVITADHGGHDRCHGTDLPEDMTIPMFFLGSRFQPGKRLTNVSILDIAPTIADIMGILPAPEWEGNIL